MGVRIISDSTVDMDKNLARDWELTTVPLKVLFGEEEYRDGIDMPLDTFYQRLRTDAPLPTTSQPSPEEFLAVFDQVKAAQDEAVVITISSNLSGTYQSACIAKDMCEYDKIYIVDSRQVTLSMQLLVRRAIRLKQDGLEGKEIAGILEAEKDRYRLYGVVDDLKYLHKGGRLSKAGATAGTMLNLKPIIEITSEGVVHVAGMSRGLNGAYGKILRIIEAAGGMDRSREFGIGYAGDLDMMNGMKEYLSSRIDMAGYVENRVGTVIGTHAGPGCCIIVCVLNKGE